MVSCAGIYTVAAGDIFIRKKNTTILKQFLVILVSLAAMFRVQGQAANTAIHRGNQLYRQQQYAESRASYEKALAADPKNATAEYNSGNALFRGNDHEEAIAAYDNTISHSSSLPLKQKAFYNKGVAYSRQQKLPESIDAWKEALKLDPNDQEARDNLEKALREKKKQDQQQQQNKDKKDKPKDQPKNQNKPQPDQQPPQQQQPQSKLSKQQVEQLLRALEQKEKEVQQKMQKGSPVPSKNEKDW
jgi:Ca-activated chloride channel family protein